MATDLTPTEKIIAIIHSFPLLERCLPDYRPKEFNVYQFMDLMRGSSHGAWLCAQAVANIWSGSGEKEKEWHLDIAEFVSIVDADNRLALMQWIARPIWP